MKQNIENSLTIAIIQYNVEWHNVSGNLLKIEEFIKKLNKRVDLIILPEMFATGFTLSPESISSEDQSIILNWMKELALKYQSGIAGSHPCLENGKFYNRLFIVSPDLDVNFYDKKHLFSIAEENKKYSKGNERKTFHIKGWNIMPLICYDLRFPVWSRNNLNYDVLIYCANWPEIRINAWEILLKARAIENQCFVIGANRIGIDGQNIKYCGRSQVISPLGELLGVIDNEEKILVIELNKDELVKLRKSFPVLDDMDTFEIN
jgi:omega-amidase